MMPKIEIEISEGNEQKLNFACRIININRNMLFDNLLKYGLSKPEALGATTPAIKSQLKKALEEIK
jgi:hypothetical protein